MGIISHRAHGVHGVVMGNKCTEEGMLKVPGTPSWAEASDWRRGGDEVCCPVFSHFGFSMLTCIQIKH